MIINLINEKLSSENKSKVNIQKAENLEEIFTRYAYKSYIYGEYDKALKYLDKLISLNPDNFVPYLYASYANEYLYKSTNKLRDLFCSIFILNLYKIDDLIFYRIKHLRFS